MKVSSKILSLSVKSVESHNGGKDTIVEFTKPYDLMLNGMVITFANAAVVTDLNKANPIIKMNDRQILLKGVAFAGEETAIANMTFTVNNSFFQSIEAPNSEDVIKTAFAVMTYAQYYPNAITLNPSDVNAMESEKDTTGRNLGIIKVVNGVKHIANRPIVESTGMLPGKYFIGDMHMGASIVDYTNLALEWAEDVETKLCNEVVLIASEEVIFPVYNPWAFAYGDLAELKEAITKK